MLLKPELYMLSRVSKNRIWQIALISGVYLLSSCNGRGVSPTPGPPGTIDPITQVTDPGAYGVPGGAQVYNESRNQLSVLECDGGTLSFRMLDSGEMKVTSLSGVPSSAKEGDRFDVLYRLMVNGYVIQNMEYEDVKVIKTTDSLLWLKKDDDTYFVLKR